jgi:cation diffusion facilitator family transporter
MPTSKEFQKEKEKWALGSLLLNFSLTVLKFVFALITGSLALMAEAIHSLSDLIVSIISLISVKLSSIKAENFPYGLYKVENIASVIIGMFLFFTAYEILKEVFFSDEKRQIKHIEYAVGVMIITMLATFLYSRFELKAAEKLNSPTLKADAEHIWADFLSSMVVIVGLVGTLLGYEIDKYAAAVVSLFIIHSGWEIFSNGIKMLLDVSLSKEEIEQIKQIIYEKPSVMEIKKIRGRSAGSHKFLELELVMHNYSLRETHKTVDDIEREIKDKIPNIDSVFIHYEPARQEGLRVAVLTDEKGNLKDFSSANKIEVYDVSKDFNYEKTFEIKVNPNEKEIGNILTKLGIDIVISRNHPEDFEVRWQIVKSSIMVWETYLENVENSLKELVSSWKEYKNKEGS